MQKPEKIAAIQSIPFVFQSPENLAGQWNNAVFENPGSLCLEVGCGYGEYVTFLSDQYPNRNFIGLDVKGPRIWMGATKAQEQGKKNIAFIRDLAERLPMYFLPEELDEIWITFPDPQPQPAKALKRLTSLRFLHIYRNILSEHGLVHFKTDNIHLFQWTLATLQILDAVAIHTVYQDLYTHTDLPEVLLVNSRYEKHFASRGHHMHYLSFSFVPEVALPEERFFKNFLRQVGLLIEIPID